MSVRWTLTLEREDEKGRISREISWTDATEAASMFPITEMVAKVARQDIDEGKDGRRDLYLVE
jgi:hypothetical protein